jgi:hypothetical protein
MEEAGKMMEKAGKIPLPMKLYFKWWTFKPWSWLPDGKGII